MRGDFSADGRAVWETRHIAVAAEHRLRIFSHASRLISRPSMLNGVDLDGRVGNGWHDCEPRVWGETQPLQAITVEEPRIKIMIHINH
jgi:hypothetical protein